MISNPVAGWCDFSLGAFRGNPSYMTNVPVDLLECFRDFLYKGCGACYFDEEGSEFVLIITPEEIFIIGFQSGKPTTTTRWSIDDKYSGVSLAKEAVADIERDYQAWVEWDVDTCKITEQKVKIDVLLATIKSMLEVRNGCQ